VRAVVYERYGPPDVLHIADLPVPQPEDDELLVRVRATTVNRTDCGFRQPRPFFVRLFSGFLRPRRPVLGTEFAGEVEAVGANVSQFAVGDRVFGVNADRFGAHAELLRVRERAPVATMPAGIDFDEAAATCDGAILALSCLRRGDIELRPKILIYGASGAIGTAAVQLAIHFGADVTAVCHTRALEIVRSLGPRRVIDYTRDDFADDGATYDVILDAVGKTTFWHCRRSLTPQGRYLSTDLGPFWQNPPLTLVTRFTGRRVGMPIPRYTKQHVALLKQLVETGAYRSVIDRRYPLTDVVEATRYVESEQKIGNVVLWVTPD
jgi:NADPH:quinone reductase-like Zn-dependent oxidoreductase